MYVCIYVCMYVCMYVCTSTPLDTQSDREELPVAAKVPLGHLNIFSHSHMSIRPGSFTGYPSVPVCVCMFVCVCMCVCE
jgi:hypothetical protein